MSTISEHMSTTGQMFTRFPDLPLEIREQIWSDFEHPARAIGITQFERIHPHRFNHPTKIECFALVPSLLHVNSESRRVALKTYQRIRKDIPVYIDLSIDILCFDNSKEFSRFIAKQKIYDTDATRTMTVASLYEGLRHIAICDEEYSHISIRGLEKFKNIRTFTSANVRDGECVLWYGFIGYLDPCQRDWAKMFERFGVIAPDMLAVSCYHTLTRKNITPFFDESEHWVLVEDGKRRHSLEWPEWDFDGEFDEDGGSN